MNTQTIMERAIIGGILLGGATSTLSDSSFTNLVPINFEDSACSRAFGVLVAMYQEKRPINEVSVAYGLVKDGLCANLKEAEHMVEDFKGCCVHHHLEEEYIKIVKRNSENRAIEMAIKSISPEAKAEDLTRIMEMIAKRDNANCKKAVTPKDYIDGYLKNLFDGKKLNINTGFATLDCNLHARPGDLVVIGARTNVGKTTFLTNILYRMLLDKIPCLFSPTEMKPEQFTSRLIPLMSTIPASKLRSLDLDNNDKAVIREAAKEVKKLPLTVLDIASPTIEEIRAAVKSSGCKVLFLDYLGRCSTTKESTRMREIEKFVVALKTICIENDIVCFLAVQLGRFLDRATSAPVLADLSDSSAIEKEADLVLLLWKEFKENQGNIINAHIAKNRHGYTGQFTLEFDRNRMAMMERGIQVSENYTEPKEHTFL